MLCRKRLPRLCELQCRDRWILLEKVADSARKPVKLAEPYKPYGGQFLGFCSISLSTYQTCMKLTRKSTEFCQFFCRQNPPDPKLHPGSYIYTIMYPPTDRLRSFMWTASAQKHWFWNSFRAITRKYVCTVFGRWNILERRERLSIRTGCCCCCVYFNSQTKRADLPNEKVANADRKQ